MRLNFYFPTKTQLKKVSNKKGIKVGMIEKENKEKIKYFVNGFSKVFDSKEEANHFVSLKGVSRSQVSMMVPAELTRRLLGKEGKMNIKKAIDEATQQKRGITRTSWGETKTVIIPTNTVYGLLVIVDKSQMKVNWMPTANDLTAEDWIVYG